MVVRKLLISVRDAQFVQPSCKSTRAVEEIELILLSAIDIERFQPAQIVRLRVDRDYGILPHPIRPALLNDLASVERDRQPDAKELRRIGIVAGGHRQYVDHLAGTLRVLSGRLELLPPALDRVLGTGERAQYRRHVGQITKLETHIAGMAGRGRPDVGVAQRVRNRAIAAGALAEHPATAGSAAPVLLLDPWQHLMQEKVLPGAHRRRVDVLIAAQAREAIRK